MFSASDRWRRNGRYPVRSGIIGDYILDKAKLMSYKGIKELEKCVT